LAPSHEEGVRNAHTRDINIDRDIDIDVDHHYGCCYRSGWGTAAVVATTAVVTAAVVGSIVHNAAAFLFGRDRERLHVSTVRHGLVSAADQRRLDDLCGHQTLRGDD
jgi:hypothetical protein